MATFEYCEIFSTYDFSYVPDMVFRTLIQMTFNVIKIHRVIANEIISLAKNIKISGTEMSLSSLIPRGDRLSEKGRKS